MTYAPHFLLSFGGRLDGEGEIWSNNIRLGPPLGGTFGSLVNIQGALEDCAADIRTYMAAAGSGYNNITKCEWVKLNEIGPDGRYASATEANTLYTADWEGEFGGTGTQQLPTSVAAAITWTTSNQRGRASRGRIFIPQPSGTISFGRFSPAVTASMAAAAAQFIRDLANWPGLDWPNSPVPVVASNLGSPGPMVPITGVRVGDVPDTMRSRRNAMDEVYENVAV